MLFRQTVKAGVLLHALLIAAVFSILLQFYVQRQVAHGVIAHESQHSTVAYAMAEMTVEEVLTTDTPPKSGSISFSTGRSDYDLTERECQVMVLLDNGKSFSYTFLRPSKKD